MGNRDETPRVHLVCWRFDRMATRRARTATRQDTWVGFLRAGEPPQSFVEGFRRGLREQGLIEGQDIIIEWGLAPSVVKLPNALADLIRLKVDVLLASGTSSVLLTRDLAGRIPVVFVAAVGKGAVTCRRGARRERSGKGVPCCTGCWRLTCGG